MFYLVRHGDTKEALGILSVREILKTNQPLLLPVVYITELIRATVYKNITPTLWYLDTISQAEYETYRDLHELKVFT